MTWREYLAGVDDSHQMTTSKEHVAILCEMAAGIRGRILELGSHAGISTAALALASPGSTIVSVDLCDTVPESARTEYWSSLGIANVQPVRADAGAFLRSSQLRLDQWSLIFHDAAHGDAVVPEYLTAAGICYSLAIHDWEQLSRDSQSLIGRRFPGQVAYPADSRGRQLWIGTQ
jgi:predicted O-methyltransferase YrrM